MSRHIATLKRPDHCARGAVEADAHTCPVRSKPLQPESLEVESLAGEPGSSAGGFLAALKPLIAHIFVAFPMVGYS
jgi:hypothetical protein